jgi:hypothetical protein
MTLQRMLLGLVLLGGLVGAAYVAQGNEPTGAKLATAAEKFVAGLTPEQKAKAVFAFDDKERTNWWFVPRQTEDRKPARKGLPLEEMTAEQKEAAKELVRAGTSRGGFSKATTIMSLEAMLHELEKNGTMVRKPGWYFFTIFGTPSKTGQWGFRVEGHHLSLNFTLDRGQVVGFTPCFFGANPADVKQGPRKGLRVLAEAEDLAKELFASLDKEQQAAARQPKQFPEIEQAKAKPDVGKPVGLPGEKMTDRQRETLLKLLQGYTDRMPADVAAAEMAEVKKAGLDKVYFAFARDDQKPGQPYTYRIQGPTFVVEFLDVQSDSAGNPANHIHSAWRKLRGDFGLAAR